MRRHFTVTGFVVERGRVLLHWHKKLQIWLPPGGHIEPDEDPIEAVLREVVEETGIAGEVIAHEPPFSFTNVAQIPSPLRIIVADVPGTADEPLHQHIDLCYAVRPLAGAALRDRGHGFLWVEGAALRRADPLPVAACGVDIAPPDDVREIALRAIALEAKATRIETG